jgi:hypothetical protein
VGGGFGQVDYALRNASWQVMDTLAELKEHEDRREGFLDPFTILDSGATGAISTFKGADSTTRTGPAVDGDDSTASHARSADDAYTAVDFGSPEEASRMVGQVAAMFGADDVGITARDERWHYRAAYSRAKAAEKPNDGVPPGLDNAIIVVTAMDRKLLQTVPSALSEAAAGLGYGWDTVVLLSMAQFLRNAGYQACPLIQC